MCIGGKTTNEKEKIKIRSEVIEISRIEGCSIHEDEVAGVSFLAVFRLTIFFFLFISLIATGKEKITEGKSEE